MSSTNSKKVMTGEALTLTWPEPDIALVTMIRDREMNTLSLELVHELDVALTLSVDCAARALIITGKGRAFCELIFARTATVLSIGAANAGPGNTTGKDAGSGPTPATPARPRAWIRRKLPPVRRPTQ
jgi:hypothetical protein